MVLKVTKNITDGYFYTIWYMDCEGPERIIIRSKHFVEDYYVKASKWKPA